MSVPAWMGRILSYFGNNDPRLAAAGSVALVIAGNQPFYPLYVAAIVGERCWPSLLTWLSTPFFLAVPAACRRYPLSGRWLLIAASVGNTVLTGMALGPASGVELFYLPCLALGPLLFRGRQGWRVAGLCLVACLAGFTVLHASGWRGLASLDAGEFASLVRLHAFSVAALVILFGFMAFRLASSRENHRTDKEQELDR